MNKQQLLEELRKIECELSPENLTCDGEASPVYVRRRAIQLNRWKAKVIKQLGYTPTFQELFNIS